MFSPLFEVWNRSRIQIFRSKHYLIADERQIADFASLVQMATLITCRHPWPKILFIFEREHKNLDNFVIYKLLSNFTGQ